MLLDFRTKSSLEQARTTLERIGDTYIASTGHNSASRHTQDVIAEKLLPPEVVGLVSLAVKGDGNCLFRSVSRILSGDEDADYLELRLRTAMELMLYEQYYLDTCKQEAQRVTKIGELGKSGFTVGTCPSLFLGNALSTG